jgi:hypothetical protein
VFRRAAAFVTLLSVSSASNASIRFRSTWSTCGLSHVKELCTNVALV